MLGSLDRRSFNGYQMAVIMAARARQVCWEQAQLLADVHELAHCAPGRHDSAPRRVEAPGSAIADEVSFTLAWTTSAALDQVSMAWAAIDCHPPLYAALAEGILDMAKLKMVLIEVDLMDSDQAAAVIAKILPEAERLTLPQLRQRVRKLVLTIDPELVRKRYRRDLTRRNVSVTDYRNGTSTIVGRYLPTDKVAAAMDFLNATATATIRAGDPGGTPFDQCDRRTAAQIRADVFLDLLAGADPTIPANQGGAGAVNPGPRKGSVHLTIELETLLCLNDHPGELDGFGPVVADIARQVADGLQDVPNWRFVLTDQGRVIHEGRLRYRPTAAQKSYVRARTNTAAHQDADDPHANATSTTSSPGTTAASPTKTTYARCADDIIRSNTTDTGCIAPTSDSSGSPHTDKHTQSASATNSPTNNEKCSKNSSTAAKHSPSTPSPHDNDNSAVRPQRRMTSTRDPNRRHTGQSRLPLSGRAQECIGGLPRQQGGQRERRR